TRTNFTDHLYSALTRAGIETFRDDKSLERGEEFAPDLLTGIGESWGSIIIFSEQYAFSQWCLVELVEIMKQREERGHRVYPIFY
ncbi:toll/interleukin-1 receptor domain-containing protein, partial [Klebsiella pneumoniae]